MSLKQRSQNEKKKNLNEGEYQKERRPDTGSHRFISPKTLPSLPTRIPTEKNFTQNVKSTQYKNTII